MFLSSFRQFQNTAQLHQPSAYTSLIPEQTYHMYFYSYIYHQHPHSCLIWTVRYLPMTTTKLFPGSHQQTKLLSKLFQKTHTSDSSLHCPHRYRTVILNWPENPEVSLSKICLIAPCNCYTFCQTFIAHRLNFNTRFQYSFVYTPMQKWKQAALGVSA